MSADVVLELRQATKKYAGVPAIEAVDFQLERGEVHALLGENGAGKSTLTKVMAGVVPLSAGQMRVEGQEVHLRTPLEALHRGIAMVFQETSLVPSMTVAQNLYLGQEKFFNRLRGIYIAAQQFLQSLNRDRLARADDRGSLRIGGHSVGRRENRPAVHLIDQDGAGQCCLRLIARADCSDLLRILEQRPPGWEGSAVHAQGRHVDRRNQCGQLGPLDPSAQHDRAASATRHHQPLAAVVRPGTGGPAVHGQQR